MTSLFQGRRQETVFGENMTENDKISCSHTGPTPTASGTLRNTAACVRSHLITDATTVNNSTPSTFMKKVIYAHKFPKFNFTKSLKFEILNDLFHLFAV